MPSRGSVAVFLTAVGGADTVSATDTIDVAPEGTPLWQVSLEPMEQGHLAYSPAVQSVLVGSYGTLISIDRRHALNWRKTEGVYGPTAVATDGAVYSGPGTALAAYRSDGSAMWTASLGPNAANTLALSADGTIAALAGSVILKTYTPAGLLKWSYALGSGGSLALDREGNSWVSDINFRQLVGITAGGVSLLTVPSSAFAAWSGSCPAPYTAVPGVGDVLLVVAHYSFSCTVGDWVFAVHKTDGQLIWSYAAPGTAVDPPGTPVAGPDGTVYLSLTSGAVIAIGPDGKERWRSPEFVTGCTAPFHTTGSPALGADGTVFSHVGGLLVAVTPTGSVKWTAPTARDSTHVCGESTPPILTSDGWLFTLTGTVTNSSTSLLSAFAAGTGADPTAPWGQFLADERHTSRGR